jgi:DNA invertase Pin-like site-specific DNA recombinase
MDMGQLKKENEQLKQLVESLEKEIESMKSVNKLRKSSMLKKASQGNLMSRAPFGYKIVGGKLVPAENFREIEEIFESFLNKTVSLNQLAKEHNLSVNGLKKILKNFTYIGKIKFNNQIYDGEHQQIISSTLFNHVQNKLERLGIK